MTNNWKGSFDLVLHNPSMLYNGYYNTTGNEEIMWDLSISIKHLINFIQIALRSGNYHTNNSDTYFDARIYRK